MSGRRLLVAGDSNYSPERVQRPCSAWNLYVIHAYTGTSLKERTKLVYCTIFSLCRYDWRACVRARSSGRLCKACTNLFGKNLQFSDSVSPRGVSEHKICVKLEIPTSCSRIFIETSEVHRFTGKKHPLYGLYTTPLYISSPCFCARFIQ